jgi:hypothetical protein
LIEFLFKWQQLVGAFVGASVPITIFFLGRLFFERVDTLNEYEETLMLCINNLVEIENNLKHFSDTKIDSIIEELSKMPSGTVFHGTAFFPLMSAFELKEDIRNLQLSGSKFLNSKILKSILVSKDLSFFIRDMQRQFENTFLTHKELLLSGKYNVDVLNASLKRNLEEYKKVLYKECFEQNIKNSLKVHIEALVTLREFRRIGLLLWRLKFFSRISFLFQKQDWETYKQKTHARIYSYLEKPIEEEIRNISKHLKVQVFK